MSQRNRATQRQNDATTPDSAQKGQTEWIKQPSTPLLIRRAYADPSSLTAKDVLHLQRTVGNRATIGILSRHTGLHAKLKLGPAGDQYEQEADRVAQQVVRQMARPQPVQRQPLEEEELQMKSFAGTISPLQRKDEPRPKMVFTKPAEGTIHQPKPPATTISQVKRAPNPQFTKPRFAQRQEEEEEELQMKPLHGPEGGEVEQSVEQQIQAARGGGQPLDDNVRGSMEQGFGADFSNVRIHTGSHADTLNRSLNARAFTTGNNIFFRSGEYNPGSSSGQQLLAHELTHTVQQGAVASLPTVQRNGWRAAHVPRTRNRRGVSLGHRAETGNSNHFGDLANIDNNSSEKSAHKTDDQPRTKRKTDRFKKLKSINSQEVEVKDPDVNKLTATADVFGYPAGILESTSSMLWDAGLPINTLHYNKNEDLEFKKLRTEMQWPQDLEIDNLNEEQQAKFDKHMEDEGHTRTIVSDPGVRENLQIAAGSIGAGASAIGGFVSFLGFVNTAKGWMSGDLDASEALPDLVNQATSTSVGVGQSLYGVGSTVAAAFGKDDGSSIFAGASDMLGVVSGIVEMITGSAKTVVKIIKVYKDYKQGKRSLGTQGLEIGQEIINVVKNFLATGKSFMTGLKYFVEVAGNSADFIQAVPLAGAIINIVVKFLEILHEAFEVAKNIIKLFKINKVTRKMKEKREAENQNAGKQRPDRQFLLDDLVMINEKRFKRNTLPVIINGINIFSEVLSICGSILNIIGVASSAAYGAGLGVMATGYATTGLSVAAKGAGAGLKPAAFGLRKAKQFGRNTIGKKFGIIFNGQKTTKAKHQRYVKDITILLQLIENLPDYDDNNATVKEQYQDVYDMIKAAGVDKEKLFESTDPKEQIRMLYEAMKEREGD
jgi:hypothetical protein